MQLSSLPSVASAAGIAERFQYVVGRSGRRHLFTETSPQLVGDFDDAVAIAVAGERIVWAGVALDAACFPASARIRACRVFIHLLAASEEDRRQIVADLQPVQPMLALAA
jgi:hypothetical protein